MELIIHHCSLDSEERKPEPNYHSTLKSVKLTFNQVKILCNKSEVGGYLGTRFSDLTRHKQDGRRWTFNLFGVFLVDVKISNNPFYTLWFHFTRYLEKTGMRLR